MPRAQAGRVLALAATLVTGGLVLAAQAQATTERPVWKCRASAGYTTINGGDRAEAVVANGNVKTARGQDPDHALCAASESGAGNFPAPLGIPADLLSAGSASAVTTISPAIGPTSTQKVSALGRVENLALQVSGVGPIVLGATVAEATANGACRNGRFDITGASRVTGLRFNGSPADTASLPRLLTAALAGLNPVVDVTPNESIRGADAVTVRALHIVVRLGSGLVMDTVVAEAKVGVDGSVCEPALLRRGPCPPGALYVAEQNLCVIEPLSGGPRIPVGSPADSPTGGRVIDLVEARRRYGRNPCLTGSGRRFAVIGTNGSDDIAGSRLADRIIARGGSDRVAATAGNDCVDGGPGNDNVSGDVGNDRIYGGAGNDTINGGPGDDRIQGQRGNDAINAAFGRDRIEGGSGRDFINIATAGRVAWANCGSGRDKVRFNRVERTHVRGCEQRYMLDD